MTINKQTIERLVTAGGCSESALASAVGAYDACNNDEERKELHKALTSHYGGVKVATQNKAKTQVENSKRAHNEDGTFKADDPSTPENEAYDPPKKKAKTKRTKRWGTKG